MLHSGLVAKTLDCGPRGPDSDPSVQQSWERGGLEANVVQSFTSCCIYIHLDLLLVCSVSGVR